MRKSTKILLILFLIFLVSLVVSFSFLMSAISLTNSGLEINMTTMSWISFSLLNFCIIFGTILYSRFLKSRRFSTALLCSITPITLIFFSAIYFISNINSYTNDSVTLIRRTLNISTNNFNHILWIIIISIIYFISIYITFKALTRPIKKIEQSIINLADGNIKEQIQIGGCSQFQTIEHYLNKINNNLRHKDESIKQAYNELDKKLPKQLIKHLGKKSILDFDVSETITKEMTTMFCEIKNTPTVSGTISLEENFNHINSYINVITPIVKKHSGYIDSSTGNGINAVFVTPKQAYECCLNIIKAIKTKNNENINLPALTISLCLNTGDITFGVTGDDDNKNLTLLSSSLNITKTMTEINKVYGSIFIFAKSTLDKLPINTINYRYIGSLNTENDSQITIFESLDVFEKDKRDKLIKNKINFEQGVRAYLNGKYLQAKSLFEKVYRQEKNDKVCYTYYNKCCDKL